MSRIVAFKANDDEQAELEAYMKAHHFKNLPDFARVAVFAYVRKNKPGAHRSSRALKTGVEAGRDSAPLTTDHIP